MCNDASFDAMTTTESPTISGANSHNNIYVGLLSILLGLAIEGINKSQFTKSFKDLFDLCELQYFFAVWIPFELRLFVDIKSEHHS